MKFLKNLILKKNYQQIKKNEKLPSMQLQRSFDYFRIMAVRSGPNSGLHVYLKTDQQDLDPSTAAIVDPKWLHLSGTFKEIELDTIDGRNFAAKLELLMSVINSKT